MCDDESNDKQVKSPSVAPVTITMEHVFNALGQIEVWIHYVRQALGGYDTVAALPVPDVPPTAPPLGSLSNC